MKNLRSIFYCVFTVLVTAFVLSSCKDEDKDKGGGGGNILYDGFYVVGEATAIVNLQATGAEKAMMAVGINEVDQKPLEKGGLYDKYVALEANKPFYVVKKEGANETKLGKDVVETLITDGSDWSINGAEVIAGTYKANGEAFTVPESKLYQIVVYEPEKKVVIIPVQWETNNLGEPYKLEPSSFNKETITFKLENVEVKANNFKFKSFGGWKYVINSEVKINCNFGLKNEFKFDGTENDLLPGGPDISIGANKGIYTIELVWKLSKGYSHTAKFKKTGTITMTYPETLYMIGGDFGDWTWGNEGIVEMIPVHPQDGKGEGAFWCINYFTAANGFKWNSAKAWDGNQFNSLGESIGFEVKNDNAWVPADGLYVVYIDLAAGKIAIEPALVYGMGNAFGNWDAGENPFTANGNIMSITTTGASAGDADGGLRMYAGSSIANTDWWTREFIILDGKIVYRGNGNDQERVAVAAGKTVSLDFRAGTGEIK